MFLAKDKPKLMFALRGQYSGVQKAERELAGVMSQVGSLVEEAKYLVATAAIQVRSALKSAGACLAR